MILFTHFELFLHNIDLIWFQWRMPETRLLLQGMSEEGLEAQRTWTGPQGN